MTNKNILMRQKKITALPADFSNAHLPTHRTWEDAVMDILHALWQREQPCRQVWGAEKKRSRPIRTKAEHAPINQRQRCSPTRKPGHATHRASAFACRHWSVPVQAAAFIESRRLWQSARDATPKKHRRCVMKDWTPSALLHASGMYWESCAIHAAVHLDVFTPLSGGEP